MNKLEQLKRPFEAHEIEWRVQQSGMKGDKAWAMCLVYVTNRAVMDRLDEVFGLAGWKNEFAPTPTMGGTMCGISFKDNGEWITKWDGAEDTQVEATKGGLSASMKRAVVHLGIGRYLYDLDVGWANVVEKGTPGAKSAKTKEGALFYWLPPVLPDWALPLIKDQLKTISKKVEESGADEKKLLEAYGVSDILNATKEQGYQIIEGLDKKLAHIKAEKAKKGAEVYKENQEAVK